MEARTQQGMSHSPTMGQPLNPGTAGPPAEMNYEPNGTFNGLIDAGSKRNQATYRTTGGGKSMTAKEAAYDEV